MHKLCDNNINIYIIYILNTSRYKYVNDNVRLELFRIKTFYLIKLLSKF